MKRNFLGLSIAMMAVIFMGCSEPDTDAPASDSVITLRAIPGVVTPACGARPVTTAIDTAQYTGTITWSPAVSQFAEKTVYTANIALTAKAGWTLTGVAANSFTVAGLPATNAADAGIVTVAFPATFAAPILTMVTVPAGSFQRDYKATNISEITTPFKMSAYEITRAQFKSIMGTDPSNPEMSKGTNDPVFLATWYDAIAFCNKLSIAEGLAPVYAIPGVNFSTLTHDDISNKAYKVLIDTTVWDAVTVNWTNNGYRLPTEMEWMWAAMGATRDRSNGYTGTGINTTGYIKGYAGSPETGGAQTYVGNYAWYRGNETSGKSQPVGGKLPNELGIYDMSGNVWEWCWDWYFGVIGDVNPGKLVDYKGPVSGDKRVLRGGSRTNDANLFELGYDSAAYGAGQYSLTSASPDGQQNNYGFRVVRR